MGAQHILSVWIGRGVFDGKGKGAPVFVSVCAVESLQILCEKLTVRASRKESKSKKKGEVVSC